MADKPVALEEDYVKLKYEPTEMHSEIASGALDESSNLSRVIRLLVNSQVKENEWAYSLDFRIGWPRFPSR